MVPLQSGLCVELRSWRPGFDAASRRDYRLVIQCWVVTYPGSVIGLNWIIGEVMTRTVGSAGNKLSLLGRDLFQNSDMSP